MWGKDRAHVRFIHSVVKPHPRIRKTVKWGGAAVTALLVVVWIGSGRAEGRGWGWWRHIAEGSSLRCYLIPNAVVFAHINPGRSNYVPTIDIDDDARNHMPAKAWRPYWSHRASEWALCVPLWIPFAGCVALTGSCWRLDTLARRRARLNLCPKCNYDRTGLVGGAGAVCPECGTAAHAARP